jgi:hypothetical protein
MGTPLSDLAQRLLALPVGKSLVANVRRADAYLRTVRRYAPGSEWAAESIDGRWVIRRLR